MNRYHLVPAGYIDVFYEASRFSERLYDEQFKHLGSDLVQHGFSSDDLQQAVERARNIIRISGRNPRVHIREVYTEREGVVMRDCRLSRLGYMLVVFNGPSTLEVVGRMQFRLMELLLSDR